MVKTSSQMKNMIEDYLTSVGLKYQDSTKEIQEKNPSIEWQLVFGKTHMTKTKNRNDRITLVNPIGFRKSADIFNKLPNSEKIPLINKINEFIILKGMTFNWIPKPPKENEEKKEDKTKAPDIEGIHILSYIDEQELTRPVLFHKLDNLSGTALIVTSLILQKIKPLEVQDLTKSEQPKGDYFQ